MRLFTYILFLMPFMGLSQTDLNSEAQEQQAIPRTATRTHGQIELTLQFSDSLDVFAIDSIIQALDSITEARLRVSSIYGHDIFRRDSVEAYQPNSIVKVPDTYVLGVGDELAISIFGVSQFDAKYQIDESGFISPAEMPKIFLKGLTWQQAKKLLIRRFSSYYIFRPEQLAIALSKPRTITVNIFGEVERPGSYNLVATNTAFNALIAAGGPTDKGSVRNIIITNGTEQKVLDVYEIMNNPMVQFHYYLEDNVVIQVPTAASVVKLEGAIQRPYLYEIKTGEDLSQIIAYAGGLQGNAVKEVIQVKRYQNDRKVILDVNMNQLTQSKQRFPLLNGDEIFVRTIQDELSNAINIEGAVENPGEYALETTPRVSDLIQKAMLKREARLDVAFLVRQNPDSTFQFIQIDLESVVQAAGSDHDLELQAKDNLVIPSQKTYADPATLKVSGAVRKSIEYPFDPSNTITLEQAILLAGGLAPEAEEYGYVVRTNPNNKKEKEYIRINIFQAIDDPAGAGNIKVQPWDEVVVLHRSSYTDSVVVSIRGAVRKDSSFYFDASLQISDLLILSGGLTPEASGILDVYRVTINKGQKTTTIVESIEVDDDFNIKGNADFELQPYDEIVARRVADFELQNFVSIEGEVAHPGAYALLHPNERLLDLVNRAGGLTQDAFAEGVYVLRDLVEEQSITKTITAMDQVIIDPSSQANFILKPGDIIMVPKKEDVVYLNLRNTRAYELSQDHDQPVDRIGVPYSPGKNAKWYIDAYAGGFGEHADKDIVTVEYANGAIQKTRGFAPFRKYPKPRIGATIIVGAHPDEEDPKDHLSSGYPNNNKGVIVNINGEGKVIDPESNPDQDNEE